MNAVKTYKGLWWLPDIPDKQIPGILTVENDAIILETIGCMGIDSAIARFVEKNAPSYDVIWGMSSDAEEISIFNSHESVSLNSASSFPIAKYNAQVVTVGKHIKSLEQLGNYNVKVYFEELSYWARPNCLHFDNQDDKYMCIADSSYKNIVKTQIEDECILELRGEVKITCKKAGMQVELEQFSSLYFIFSRPISICDAKQKVFIFEQFLSFATLAPVQYDRFLLIEKYHHKSQVIEIYETKENNVNNSERFWEYLFVYETIKESFPLIIKKWYEEKNIFPIRAHLIDSIRQKGSFCSTDFLITVQAVEGFYCRFRKDKVDLSNILTNLKNEFSDISILEFSEHDIVCIRDSRHYYSHLLPPGKKVNVVDGYELYILNYKLRKLLLCCMLNFVGFSNEDINRIFSKSGNSYLQMINERERNLNNGKPIELNGQILSANQTSEIIS